MSSLGSVPQAIRQHVCKESEGGCRGCCGQEWISLRHSLNWHSLTLRSELNRNFGQQMLPCSNLYLLFVFNRRTKTTGHKDPLTLRTCPYCGPSTTWSHSLSKPTSGVPVSAYLASGPPTGDLMITISIWYRLQQMGCLKGKDSPAGSLSGLVQMANGEGGHGPTHISCSRGKVWEDRDVDLVAALEQLAQISHGTVSPNFCKQPDMPHIILGAHMMYVRMFCRRLQHQ